MEDIIKFHVELSDSALDFYGAAKAYYAEKGYTDFDEAVDELFEYFKSEKQKSFKEGVRSVNLAITQSVSQFIIDETKREKLDVLSKLLESGHSGRNWRRIIVNLISELEKESEKK